MNTDTTDNADPIAEIHAIRRRLAAEHGNDPRRLGDFLRQRQQERGTKTVRVQEKPVPSPA